MDLLLECVNTLNTLEYVLIDDFCILEGEEVGIMLYFVYIRNAFDKVKVCMLEEEEGYKIVFYYGLEQLEYVNVPGKYIVHTIINTIICDMC